MKLYAFPWPEVSKSEAVCARLFLATILVQYPAVARIKYILVASNPSCPFFIVS